jgi:hypothetical protein
LVDALITAFVYQPTTKQKVIHILIAKHKAEIDLIDNEQDWTHISSNPVNRPVSSSLSLLNGNSQLNDYPVQKKHKCYAIKCHILHAKGIIPHPMLCPIGHNICSGCTMEYSKLRKVKTTGD